MRALELAIWRWRILILEKCENEAKDDPAKLEWNRRLMQRQPN